MVHKNRARSSSLFLMELIIAILFFSVASAICLQFFVKSHLLSLDSDILTFSVNECSSAAEIICTAESLEDGISLLRQQYPEGKYPDSDEMAALANALNFPVESADVADHSAEETIWIFFDNGFLECQETSAAYIMDIHLTCREQMVYVVLQVYKNNNVAEKGNPIYLLETRHHIARRSGK